MESAILGVILDSSLVIEAERQQLNVAQFLKQIVQKLGEREAALSSITVAELVHGIHRANTADRRARRRAFLDDLKATVPVYPITENTAELVGKISGESSAKGVTIPFDDLSDRDLCPGTRVRSGNPESTPLREDPRSQAR